MACMSRPCTSHALFNTLVSLLRDCIYSAFHQPASPLPLYVSRVMFRPYYLYQTHSIMYVRKMFNNTMNSQLSVNIQWRGYFSPQSFIALLPRRLGSGQRVVCRRVARFENGP